MYWLLAALHLSILYYLIAKPLRSKIPSSLELFLVVFVLIWLDFILVSYTLSAFKALGNSFLFIGLSIAYAAAFIPLLHYVEPFAPDKPWQRQIPAATLFGYLIIIIGVVMLACNIYIACRLVPTNGDTISYRYPRPFLYLANGNLMHFTQGVDARLYDYPFNGVILQSFFVHHQLEFPAFTLSSCFCWALVGLAIYRTCRNLEAPKLACIAAGWLVCSSPQVLIQATSGNDEILAAAPLVVGLLMLHRWLTTQAPSHLLLAAVCAGIAFGTKLHFGFYWPLVAAMALSGVLYFLWKPSEAWAAAKPHLLPFTFAVLIVAALAVPFAVINVVQEGRFMSASITGMINRPFDFAVGLQTTVLYTSQLFVGPILDLLGFVSRSASREVNAFLIETFFFWVNNAAPFTAFDDRFPGPWYSADPSEFTLFVGFTPYLIVAGGYLAYRTKSAPLLSRIFMGILAASFVVWLITFSFNTRYVGAIGTYFTYCLSVAGPAIAIFWFPTGSPRLERFKIWLLGFVLICNFMMSYWILTRVGHRNVRMASERGSNTMRKHLQYMDSRIVKEFSNAPRVHIRYTHWLMGMYMLMRASPRPIYTHAGHDVIAPGVMNVTVLPAEPRYGHLPLQVYPPGSPNGLTYLGIWNSVLGNEYTFVSGLDVEKRYPEASGYIVMDTTLEKQDNSFSIHISPEIRGLAKDSAFQYKYRIVNTLTDEVLAEVPFSEKAGQKLVANGKLTDKVALDVTVSDGAREYTVRAFPGGSKALLPRLDEQARQEAKAAKEAKEAAESNR